VIGQEGLHRAAQQRRIVARHRRHDQHFRLRAARTWQGARNAAAAERALLRW
jgi:hypothetical protein